MILTFIALLASFLLGALGMVALSYVWVTRVKATYRDELGTVLLKQLDLKDQRILRLEGKVDELWSVRSGMVYTPQKSTDQAAPPPLPNVVEDVLAGFEDDESRLEMEEYARHALAENPDADPEAVAEALIG